MILDATSEYRVCIFVSSMPSMLEDLLLFLTTKIKKTAVWKTIFGSEHLNTDQSQLAKCFTLVACFACCSLGDSSKQRCPGKICKRKTYSRLSSVLSNTHTLASTQMRRCVLMPFVQRNSDF